MSAKSHTKSTNFTESQ